MAISDAGRNTRQHWRGLLFALVVVIGGLGLIAYLISTRGVPDHYEAAIGTAVDVEIRSSDGGPEYIAEIRFLDSDNIEYTFSGQVKFETGEGGYVDVVYDPRDPVGTASTAGDRGDSWTWLMVVVGFAVLMAGMLLGFRLFEK